MARAARLLGLIIAVAAWRIFRDGLRVLLEATPHEVDVTGMIDALKSIAGVKSVHDVHVWSISPEIHAMSCHVVIGDVLTSQAADIRQKIEEVLKERFHIEHSALQMECDECNPNDIFCKLTLGSNGTHSHEKHD